MAPSGLKSDVQWGWRKHARKRRPRSYSIPTVLPQKMPYSSFQRHSHDISIPTVFTLYSSSIATAFPAYSHNLPRVFPVLPECCHSFPNGILMPFPQYSYSIADVLLCDSHNIPEDSHSMPQGLPRVFSCCFQGSQSIGNMFPDCSRNTPRGFPWYSHGVFPKYCHRISNSMLLLFL